MTKVRDYCNYILFFYYTRTRHFMHYPSTMFSHLFRFSRLQHKAQHERHMRRPAHDHDVINSITAFNLCCGTYRQACKPRPCGSSFALLQRGPPTAIQLVNSVFVILSVTGKASLLASKRTNSTVGSRSTQLSLSLKVNFIFL